LAAPCFALASLRSKRYTVRFTPEAEDDLLRLYDFLLERDLRSA
jgi:hypothetical protein